MNLFQTEVATYLPVHNLSVYVYLTKGMCLSSKAGAFGLTNSYMNMLVVVVVSRNQVRAAHVAAPYLESLVSRNLLPGPNLEEAAGIKLIERL